MSRVWKTEEANENTNQTPLPPSSSSIASSRASHGAYSFTTSPHSTIEVHINKASDEGEISKVFGMLQRSFGTRVSAVFLVFFIAFSAGVASYAYLTNNTPTQKKK